jgi:PPOX class probable F420-dependent enzyme
MNQRHLIQMTPPEVDEFLRCPNTAAVCTLNLDLTIHAVALFYGFHGGAVAVHTKAKSQKARNVMRNPTMTVLVESGTEYAELRGVQLVGRAHVIEDEDAILALSDEMKTRYRPTAREKPEETRRADLKNRVLIWLEVQRTVSWDHRKLTLAGGH